jgi:hypothetical protein
MSSPWSVQDAKARLSKLLALARAGEPQRIGLVDSCIVVSESEWASKNNLALGAWLVDTAPRGPAIEEPSRASRRGDPFEQHLPKRKKPRQ